MVKLKSEKYKGVRIDFTKSEWNVVADASDDFMGMEEGRTKVEAFARMKATINRVLKYEKGSSKVRRRYPSGTEEIMERES